MTSSAGVKHSIFRTLFTLNLEPKSTIVNNFGELLWKISLVLPLSRRCQTKLLSFKIWSKKYKYGFIIKKVLQEEYFKLYKLKNRKKNRRLAVEIEKKFDCPYHKCYKNYGSDVSLNLHIKIKHNGGNKTDREKLAE